MVPPLVELPTWLKDRSSGIFLHATSLPGRFGIGNIGESARKFTDFLAKSGFGFWQTCPVGPTGYGDSPYQVFSSSAGNPYLIDWQQLIEIELINETELAVLISDSHDDIDYGHLYENYSLIAEKAYLNFDKNRNSLEDRYGSFSDFKELNMGWLNPYCCYQVYKKESNNKPWWKWQKDIRTYNSAMHSGFSESQLITFDIHAFLQFIFFSQWNELRSYANLNGIKIIGDLPIYVAPDSADVWERPELFQLDEELGNFTHVAGVPPDYFNEDGQFWGNPLYDWEVHREDGYKWWMDRLDSQLRLFDVVRIDHFRGFHNYWSIPVSQKDAKLGNWKTGPGLDFWKLAKKRFPTLPFLAEDLGLITDGVRKLRCSAGLPGMAVLQFAFDGDPENLYLPHNLNHDLVLYTGTHDNDTTCGWYHSTLEEVRGNFRTYFNIPAEFPSWDMLRMAYRTTAKLVVIPMQDLLSLGSEARLNEPGAPFGNWTWRMSSWELDRVSNECSDYIKGQAEICGRLPIVEKLVLN